MAEPSTRFVLCGDVNGNLDQLHKVLTKIKESDAFAACFCTGSFFKPAEGEACSLSEAELTLSDTERAFVSGSRQFPLPVAFVDSSASPLGAWLRGSCPHGADLAPNFRFLGAYGVYKFGSSGIRLAFVSGLEHPHRPPIAESRTDLFRGPYFTTELIGRMHSIRAAEAGSVDLLLTCMWPSRLEKFLSDECRGLLDEALKVGAEEIGFSEQISEWSRDFESRYHVAAGKGCFYQRPPFAGSTFGYCRRFVGLASLSSGQKTAKPLMKSMHALDLCHLRCKSASTLKALPPNCTSDPLTSSKRPLPVVSEEAPPRKIVRVEDDRRAAPGSSRSVHVGNL
ncbi:MAG: hypothetical protein KVP17_002274, partial [Porospora cf. gigantea B]|uniref:uncharacterized protein n=2 Tax=Porospora cf. gigantea B TaxID=2853592 RepID=UPI003571B82C